MIFNPNWLKNITFKEYIIKINDIYLKIIKYNLSKLKFKKVMIKYIFI